MLSLRRIYFLFFVLLFFIGFSQKKSRVERLLEKISISKDDTNKVKDLVLLGKLSKKTDNLKANEYYTQAFNLATKLNFIAGKILVYNAKGDEYWFRTNYDKAFDYYFKAYRLNDSIHDERGVAESLYNLGWIGCIQQHNYKDDKYLYKSFQISLRLKDSSGLKRAYNALSSYYNLKFDDLKDKQYFDSSVKYTSLGIEISKKNKSYENLAVFYVNLGDLFYTTSDFKSSKFYISRAIEIYSENKDSMNLISCICRDARCEAEIGNVDEALKTLKFVIDYSKKNNNKELEVETMLMLSKAYQKTGDCIKELETFKVYSELKDELDKKAFSNSISNLESNFSLEKAEVSMNELRQTKEIEELKNKKKSYFIFVLVGIGIVVIFITFLLFRQNKMRQQTNIQLQEQNNIIKEKKEEIDHSIQYAKGIQQAILPDISDLNDIFNESFIFYKPKDVVSGDFYWFAKVDTDFYCVAADCTGHGVPGALMSIIGSDKINQALYEKKISDPDKVLSFLNVQIKNVLKQHSDASTQKDGMDIAILKFNADKTSVEYSAANRPLFLIRNNELIEYKATKTAIAGFTPNNQVFDKHLIELKKDDSLFIFTDGYADQFGGPSGGKKIMTRKLKELLISGKKLPANKQKEMLEAYFLQWKGSFEQTDDVLVIGITI